MYSTIGKSVLIALLVILQARGQAGHGKVTTDAKGRIITLYEFRRNNGNPIRTYLGSPFLGNTEWHPGALIYRNQQTLPVEMSYNLIFNQIQCRLPDSSKVFTALPDEFIFEGEHFINDPFKTLGSNQVSYYQTVYDGKTKLLRKWRRKFDLINRSLYGMKVSFDDMFDGKYTSWEELYLQKKGQSPTFITLDIPAIKKVLPDLPLDDYKTEKLTESTLITALSRYDAFSKEP
ncbi:MAG: hypothetical protein DSM106950_45040 [Stigonema ocellatum SAG 48.90 = DSM 106950]|nr:hypothetical protein [Stigonema ocellatum SAG 48.90 = DSM 106950]